MEFLAEQSIDESTALQLEALDMRFDEISLSLMNDFCLEERTKTPKVFDLGGMYDTDVMGKLVHLIGYRKLQNALRLINADFSFQVLPSAGMARPSPKLLVIIERQQNYGTNCTEKNKYMYPEFCVNDNTRFGQACSTQKTPIQINFA